MHENAKISLNSIDIGRAALHIALTANRAEEMRLKERLAGQGIRTVYNRFHLVYAKSAVNKELVANLFLPL